MTTIRLQTQEDHDREGWLVHKTAVGVTPVTFILAGIIALSAFLHFYRLDSIGSANLYYTAAVESMLQSGHNFFFVAAEPGASVTVDKPPLGLWIEAASAFVFGVNGLAVVLPNILAGLFSIPLIYHLVKKYFGAGGGLIAALVIAITPVSIAAERNNTMDGMLTFTLILAAWAFLQAVETDRVRFLWLGAFIMGLGFNIKMMQAFLPLPAFYAVYFLGAKASIGRKIINLVVAAVILLVVSLSWAVAVDLTPAEERPYIGSSTDNSVMQLILGHNGLNRWLGGGGRRDDGSAPANNPPPGRFVSPNDGPPNNNLALPDDGQRPLPPPNNRTAPPGGPFTPPDDGQRPPGPPNGQNRPPGGFNEMGEAGILRFFHAPLSKELSWLLPFALLTAPVVLFGHKLTWPLARKHQLLVLWGGWLLTSLIFFSFASFFHAYYMVMLAPPLAALVGMGAAALWQLRRARPRLAAALLVGTAVITFAYQWFNASQFIDAPFWLPLAAGLLLIGAGLVWRRWPKPGSVHWPQFAGATLLAAIMITPFAWSTLTTLDENNVNLPGAYRGNSEGGGPGNAKRAADPHLLAYLEANTQDVAYLMAVPGSMPGAEYVLASGRPVLYMGGFNGSDPVVAADDIAQMVADGELRYIMLGDGRRGNQQGVNQWVQANCTAVPASETGMSSAPGPDNRQNNSELYRCGG